MKLNKGLKIFLWVVLGIFLLAGIVAAAAEIILHRKVNELVAGITNTPPAPYSIKTGKVSYSFVRGAFAVDDLRIETIQNDNSATHTSIVVDRIALNGINFRRIKMGKYRLSIRSVDVIAPVMTVNTYSGEMNRQKESKPQNDIRKTFSLLRVRNASIENGSAVYNIRDNQSSMSVSGINAELDNFVIDSTFNDEKIFGDGLVLTIDSLRQFGKNSEVVTGLDNIKFDSRTGSMTSSAFRVTPLDYPKYEYAAKVASHSDWTEWNIDSISVHGIDLPAMITSGILDIDSVSLVNGTAWSYKDRKVPQEPSVKKLFFLALHEMPTKLKIRSIVLHNFNVTYEELSENGDTPGAISINDINAEFKGLTNIYTGENEYYTLEAECKFQDSGYNKSLFRLPINPDNDHFEIEGRVGPMELAVLNPTFIPLSNFAIKSGRLKSVDYFISGNNLSSQTRVAFLYDDLSIELLKKGPDGELTARKFLTNILGTVVVRSSNPRPGGKLHEGKGTFDRDLYRSQYNYLWKSLFSGIKNTVI